MHRNFYNGVPVGFPDPKHCPFWLNSSNYSPNRLSKMKFNSITSMFKDCNCSWVAFRMILKCTKTVSNILHGPIQAFLPGTTIHWFAFFLFLSLLKTLLLALLSYLCLFWALSFIHLNVTISAVTTVCLVYNIESI